MTKYIFVTGGVISGLGKGITAASLGRLLKQRGLKVAAQKLDPYINVDPGTMSPFQHGEVFVTEDGAETDLDLGHYERFIDEDLNRFSNMTSGRVYFNVLERERNGGYLGETVQVIPHVTNEIKDFIRASAETTGADVLITEIGGTVGDIESLPFLEAIRQISLEVGRENCLFVHVTLVPFMKETREHKSKPTQHSVKEMRSIGLSPNLIVTRSDEALGEKTRSKISLFCSVRPDCVIENTSLDCLYEVPLALHANGIDDVACRELGLKLPPPDLTAWQAMVRKIKARDKNVVIALVGKYVKLHDAYLSVVEALYHAGYEHGARVEIRWIDSEKLTIDNAAEVLREAQGIIVPGGFGERGVEGMVAAAHYARTRGVPYFGICLGMQVAVIEFARHACGMADANSSEFDAESTHPVIDLMADQRGVVMGGTMRLGAYPCHIVDGTRLRAAYGSDDISERHRHRYEFNNAYREDVEGNGMRICGMSPDERLVEAVEVDEHPHYIGVQFHPEFKSRPNRPHPLFVSFVGASLQRESL